MNEEKQTVNEERISAISEDEIEEIRSRAREKALTAVHNWKQRGNRIVCTACEYEHGAMLPPNVRLIDIKENGSPVFKKLK